jgi:hypothetical protein
LDDLLLGLDPSSGIKGRQSLPHDPSEVPAAPQRLSDGISPAFAFATYPVDGLTGNALVIGRPASHGGPTLNDGHLVAYFQAEVLHGSGAFPVLADGSEKAMRLKL